MSEAMSHLFKVASDCAEALVSAPDADTAKDYAVRGFFEDDEALTATQVPDDQVITIEDDEGDECVAAGVLAAREAGIIATTEHP